MSECCDLDDYKSNVLPNDALMRCFYKRSSKFPWPIMSTASAKPLAVIYQRYIETILKHDLDALYEFVDEHVVHNQRRLGLNGYKQLIQNNIIEPNCGIEIVRLVADDSHVASNLLFTIPKGTTDFLGLKVDGQEFTVNECVIYDFKDAKIVNVISCHDSDKVKSHVVV